jgi:hypothetical protein
MRLKVHDTSAFPAGWVLGLTIFIVLVGAVTSVSLADPNIGGVTIVDTKAKIENQTCFSFEATARMEAAPSKVYNALTAPENWRRALRVVESPDHRTKTLEFDLVGSKDEPPPDKYVVYQVEYSFDPQELTVSGRMLHDQPLPWNEQYALSPLRSGTETLVKYRSWQCSPERPGDKLRTAGDLARDLGEGFKWRLEGIERPIRYEESSQEAPQFRNGLRVYPTALATPLPPQR